MQPLETLTASVLDAVARGEADGTVDAVDLLFLLRRYATTHAASLGDALGRALAVAIAGQPLPNATITERADWLSVFVEASALTDDDRLRAVATDLVRNLVSDTGYATGVFDGMRVVEACLRAVSQGIAPGTAAGIVDRLEEIVAHAYRPGQGVAPALQEGGSPRMSDQIAAASALLTAHEATGRLPYAMLAEELVQSARRLWWVEPGGPFRDDAAGDAPLDTNCRAVRVLCRLAALHGDHEYTSEAVVAADADYRGDAGCIIRHFHDRTAAVYGIALAEYVDLK